MVQREVGNLYSPVNYVLGGTIFTDCGQYNVCVCVWVGGTIYTMTRLLLNPEGDVINAQRRRLACIIAESAAMDVSGSPGSFPDLSQVIVW